MKSSWSQHGSFQLFRKLAYGFGDSNLISFDFEVLRMPYTTSPSNSCAQKWKEKPVSVIILFGGLASTLLLFPWEKKKILIYLFNKNVTFMEIFSIIAMTLISHYITSMQMSVCTNCIALKLILSCEWKLWQPLLSLQFYQKSTRWNHGNNMWHTSTKKSWLHQSQYIL